MVSLMYRGPPNINEYIRAKHGIRPKNDPASVFMAKVAKPIQDVLDCDVPVLVAERWDDVNALTTKKFILISPQSLTFLSIDGVAALIGHELIHVSKGHVFERQLENPEIHQVVEKIGKKRLQEYEADLRPMTVLAEAGYNPRGVYELQKLLAKVEVVEDLKSDLIHGSAVFRMLASQYIFRNRMIKNLSHQITEIPRKLKVEYPSDEFTILTERKNGGFKYEEEKRLLAARDCHPMIAVEVLGQLPNDSVSETLIERGTLLFHDLPAEDAKLLAALYSKLLAEKPASELPKCLKTAAGKSLEVIAVLLSHIPEKLSVQNDGFFLFRSLMNELNSAPGHCFCTENTGEDLCLIDALSKICKSDLRDHQNVRSILAISVVRAAKREGRALKEALELIPLMPENADLLEWELEKLYKAKNLKLGKKEKNKTEEDKPDLDKLEKTEQGFFSALLYWEKNVKYEEESKLEKAAEKEAMQALQLLLRTYNINSFEDLNQRLNRIEAVSRVPIGKLFNSLVFNTEHLSFASGFRKSYENEYKFLRAAIDFDWDLGYKLLLQHMKAKKHDWREWDEFVDTIGEKNVNGESVRSFFPGSFSSSSEAERNDYFRMLKKLPGHGSVCSYRSIREELTQTDIINAFISDQLQVKFDLDNPEHLDQLLTVSWFINIRGVRIRAVNTILERLLPTMKPREAIDFVLSDPRCKDIPMAAIESYIEKHVSDPQDLKYCTRKLEEKIKSISRSDIGIASLVEDIIQHLNLEPFELLKALITDKSDGKMWNFLKDFAYNEKFAFTTYHELLNLPTADRYLLLTYLLMGTFKNKKGVLLDKKSRKELWNWYFREYVKAEDRSVHNLVKKKGSEFVKKAEPEDLFFAILPLLHERLLVQPKHSSVLVNEMEPTKSVEDESSMLAMLEAVLPHTAEARLVKISEVEVIRKVASKMGAPGVRFLQSLGMVADIPPNIRASFEGIYDSMKNQTKLTAYDTIKQEGKGLENRITIGAPIGGGSLMTVYEGTFDGERVAIHVMNPNALFFTDTTIKAMDAILEDPDFSVARPLLDNVRSWVENDIRFNIRNHHEFAKAQAGWEFEGMRAYVPKLYYESGNVAIDEYIEGCNLTQMEGVRKIADPKKIAQALMQNVLHQLFTGYIHPDIHPGNIRIADDGRLVWLDSLFIMGLDQRDMMFAAGMVSPQGADSLVDYIGQSATLDREPVKAILGTEGSWADKLVKVSLELQNQGVNLPLKTMLLLKDFLALNSIVKKLGYEKIEDAL